LALPSDTGPDPSPTEPAQDSSPHTVLPPAGTPPPSQTTQTFPATGAPATLPGSSRAAYNVGGPRLWPDTDLLHSQAQQSSARDSASDNMPIPPRPRPRTTGPSGPDRSHSPHRRRTWADVDCPSGLHDEGIPVPPRVPIEPCDQSTLAVAISQWKCVWCPQSTRVHKRPTLRKSRANGPGLQHQMYLAGRIPQCRWRRPRLGVWSGQQAWRQQGLQSCSGPSYNWARRKDSLWREVHKCRYSQHDPLTDPLTVFRLSLTILHVRQRASPWRGPLRRERADSGQPTDDSCLRRPRRRPFSRIGTPRCYE